MFLLTIAFVLLICVLAGLWIYARWNHGILEEIGIPIVNYSNPLLGTTRELYSEVGGMLDVKWMKQYGQIFGVYEGREAQVMVCNPDLVRLICVKDAEYFNSKRRLDFNDVIADEFLDFQQDYKKWKLLRSMVTPVFTNAKLKLMHLPMREATQDFVSDLKQKIQKSGKGIEENVALNTSIHAMLTDLIARSLFSIKVTGANDVNNEFAKLVQDLFVPPTDTVHPEVMIWTHAFPFIRRFLPPTIFSPEPVHKFASFFRQMMTERRKSGQRMSDVVDLCLDWWDKLDSPEFKQLKINEMALLAQALAFFIAAQDQISTMISAVIYHMIKNPELETRIYEEVDRVFAKHGGKIEHQQLKELLLINSCLSECLRLYTFFHRAERVCTQDWESEEHNLKIKKGTVMLIPIWALNRNPEWNEKAEEFDPDRYLPGNRENLNPYSTGGFGFGPRNCPGMNFANEAMPIILAYLLKDLKFVGRKDTELSFVPGGPHFTPMAPILVDIKER